MRWQLAHKDHAIERVNVTFQFAESIQTKPWQTLLSKASLELPRVGFNSASDEIDMNFAQILSAQGIQPGAAGAFVIGPGGLVVGSGQQSGGGAAGRTFRMVAGNEVREEISINRNRFVYGTTQYDGWTLFKERLVSLVGSGLDQALQLVNLAVLKLEYWDRFVFDGPIGETSYEGLLKSGSKFLPSFQFEGANLWHSHIGFFKSAGLDVQRLINLNVDVMDLLDTLPRPLGQPLEPRRSLGIYSMSQDSMSNKASPTDSIGTMAILDDQHIILKDLLAEVITVEAAGRISLNASS